MSQLISAQVRGKCTSSTTVRTAAAALLPEAAAVLVAATQDAAMAEAVWYADARSKDEISFVRDARSTMSRRSPSPTRESFGGEVYGERDLDRLETRKNRLRSPKKGVFQEPPDHRRGPTALDASQLRRGGRHGFTGRDGARMGWHTMHMGATGTFRPGRGVTDKSPGQIGRVQGVVARDHRGHNRVYSRAYPRTTPSGTHTIYSNMQESHKKGPAADAMADLERFESQVLVNTKCPGGHSFRKLCAKDLMDEQEGGDNGDDEREWADEDALRDLIESDQRDAATEIQRFARGRKGRKRVEKERPQLVLERKEREQRKAVKFAEEEERKQREGQ
jgi:hypothetical protein